MDNKTDIISYKYFNKTDMSELLKIVPTLIKRSILQNIIFSNGKKIKKTRTKSNSLFPISNVQNECRTIL